MTIDANLKTTSSASGPAEDTAIRDTTQVPPAPAVDASYGQMVRDAGGTWVGDTITFTPDALVRFRAATPPAAVPERFAAAFRRRGFFVPETLDEAVKSAANIMIEDGCIIDHRRRKAAETSAATVRAERASSISPWELTARLEGDSLMALLDQIGDRDECYEVTLAIGIAHDEDGKEERGLYCWQNEYPSESLVLIKELPALEIAANAPMNTAKADAT